MADDALTARREARRRRILANSEDRMKKVLGQSEEKSYAQAPPPLPARPPSPILSSNDGLQDDASPAGTSRATSETSHKPFSSPDAVPAESQRRPQTFESKETQHFADSQEPPGSRKTPDKELEFKQDAARKFQRLKQILSVILAILVRIVLASKLGETFVKSIFMPFLTMELALFQYQKVTHIDIGCLQKSTLWVSALMLSGMNPDILHTYNKLSAICSSMADDFALYFFTFVLMHVVL